MTRVVRGVGWFLVVAGAVVLLYVVYLLWFTGLETGRAQQELAEAWSRSVPAAPQEPDTPAPAGGDDGDRDAAEADDEPVEVGEAYAALWFERDGERIVNEDVLYVVEGVTIDALRRGPGHYPQAARPGAPGNFAVAGHRTTYGAPFWSLDQLRDGDTIHVLDPQGREWVYGYVEQHVVAPTEVWVVEQDPLGTGAPTITLTTCHPRGSARQRLVAWGELVGDPLDEEARATDASQLPET